MTNATVSGTEVPTTERLEELFNQTKLGRIWMPHGSMYLHPGGRGFSDSSIRGLHGEMMLLWPLVRLVGNDLKPKVDISNIEAIYVFGSAVKGAKIIEVPGHFLWWKWISHREKRIEDIDILVLCKKEIYAERDLDAQLQHTYDCGTWVKRAGWHVVHHSVDALENDEMIKRVAAHAWLLAGKDVLNTHRISHWYGRQNGKVDCNIGDKEN